TQRGLINFDKNLSLKVSQLIQQHGVQWILSQLSSRGLSNLKSFSSQICKNELMKDHF
ncbi:MAG: hypothetical protein MHPSP_003501, partial [Paramarteilia canceri]